MRDLRAPLKHCQGGEGSHYCETGPRSSPFVLSISSSLVFLFSLVLFAAFLQNPIPSTTDALSGQCEICSALLCPTSPVLSPRSLRVGGQCPHPPTASLAGRSLIPHVHAQHPLLPPVFSRFGLVLTPQLSHKFSHLCLQTSLLSSKRRIKRIKRDEI